MINFSGSIDTDLKEKEVFQAFKRFIGEQFQECEFAVSGEETLSHKFTKQNG